jgi:hypothetical protein
MAQTFMISKEKREEFHEFMEKCWNELGSRLTVAEINIQDLRRDIRGMKGSSYGYYETDRTYISFREYFSQERASRLDLAIDRQLANKIYRPLALSTTVASSVLAISLGIVATPILVIPFAFTALFSLYYWHLQGEKG